MTAVGLYSVLLHLYPSRFRQRFGPEMVRLFEDCYPETGAAAFCLENLKDSLVSASREWRREFFRPEREIDYTGLADATMATIVVGTLLMGWGIAGASFARSIGILAGREVLLGMFASVPFTLLSLGIGTLVGVLSRCAASRSGRIDDVCSQFITSARTTVR